MEGVAVTGLHSAEDHGCADHERYNVSDAPDLGSDGDEAHAVVHRDAGVFQLVDYAAQQEDEDSLPLIALHCRNCFLLRGSGSDHYHESGDLSRDKRYAQSSDL